MNKEKKIILRKCVISNQMFPKKELIRIVKTSNNEVIIDLTGKKNGHGAYIKPTIIEVFEKAKKTKSLDRALHVSLNEKFYDDLKKILNNVTKFE